MYTYIVLGCENGRCNSVLPCQYRCTSCFPNAPKQCLCKFVCCLTESSQLLVGCNTCNKRGRLLGLSLLLASFHLRTLRLCHLVWMHMKSSSSSSRRQRAVRSAATTSRNALTQPCFRHPRGARRHARSGLDLRFILLQDSPTRPICRPRTCPSTTPGGSTTAKLEWEMMERGERGHWSCSANCLLNSRGEAHA